MRCSGRVVVRQVRTPDEGRGWRLSLLWRGEVLVRRVKSFDGRAVFDDGSLLAHAVIRVALLLTRRRLLAHLLAMRVVHLLLDAAVGRTEVWHGMGMVVKRVVSSRESRESRERSS